VGYKFSLVLSREITDDESVILQEAGCSSAVFGTDSLPTNADVTVTKMDFDDTASRTLADAIESALEAVKKVPDLTVPGLTVPAQPAEPPAEETEGTETPAKSDVLVGEVVEKPAAKKPRARRTSASKASAKKATIAEVAEVAVESG
jgi:hypothetical protein